MDRQDIPPIRRAIAELPSSKIREVANLGTGMDGVIPLWFGEPDRPTPDFINRAATAALEAGHTFYTLNRGIPELRSALAEYMTDLHGQPIDVNRVSVTASAMNAIAVIMQSLIDPGDNAVLVAPLWPNIAACVRIMDGEPRFVALQTEGSGQAEGPGRAEQSGWRLDLDHLFDAADERTRAIFINSPNNPTGWTMSGEDQRAVLDWCRARGIWLIADEVYDRIAFSAPRAPSFLDFAGPDDPLIRVNSFSKSWCMTGWRLGWVTAPEAFGGTMEKMNEYNVANAPSMAQHAGIAALRDGEDFVAASVERYRRARDLVFQRLRAFPRVELSRPEAAFYAFFKVDGVDDSLALAKRLVREARVGLAPGVAFGPEGEGYLRLCFAAGLDTLSEALDRLEPALR